MSYELDRISPLPRFFVVVKRNNSHRLPVGTVLTENLKHDRPGWVWLGFVSRQTPCGQGTFMGFPEKHVREARGAEIRVALMKDHPHGSQFRPRHRGLRDRKPTILFNHQELEKAREEARREYDRIIRNWDNIIAFQKKAIADKYGFHR